MRPNPDLSIRELSALTPWTEQALRTMTAKGALKEGEHFFHLGRLTVPKWDAIVGFIERGEREEAPTIPLKRRRRSFYKLFCSAQRVLAIRMRELYATKGTYVSTGLTRGVNLAWLSQQTGIADGTLRRHYGRFIHTDADALALPKIDSDGLELVQFAAPKGNRSNNPLLYRGIGGAEGI